MVLLLTCISVPQEIKASAFGVGVRSYPISDVLAMTWLLLESQSMKVFLFTWPPPVHTYSLLSCADPNVF